MGKYVARDFPDAIAVLRRLSAVDRAVGEICRDYDEIAALLDAELGAEASLWRDIARTLAGLRKEIEDLLERASVECNH